MRNYVLALLAMWSLTTMAEGVEKITVDGKTRSMIVHVPADTPDNSPLVITLHGFNQSADYQRNTTRWDAVADTAKFAVVYPDAINSWWDVYGNSDLHFVESIIDYMHDKYKIDTDRVYVSGFSLGSMMTYHCLEHLSDKIAAVGPVSGVRFDNRPPASSRPVPIIHTHGTSDDVFKWEGDPGHQAGGYPYIPDYVKEWADYYGLNPQTTVIDPYRNASYTLWQDDNTTVEVALLAVKGCGHWHSEGSDWGDVSTSQEIWNFVKRYSLADGTGTPPNLLSAEPENESFDLPGSVRSFTYTFDRNVEASRVKAELKGADKTYNLELTNDADSPVLNFQVADGEEIADGEYTLALFDVYNPEGGRDRSYGFKYTYGVIEVGEKLNVDTIISNDWDTMQATVGEGIPVGWVRTNSNSDGTQDKQTSGTPNTGGARLKYFQPGGDFSTGFYFSARDYQKCELLYGKTTGHSLVLEPGIYDLTFRSAYWNDNSETQGTTFDVELTRLSNAETKYGSATRLKSGASLKENTNQPVLGSTRHYTEITLPKKDRCALRFTIASGWNAVVLGDILLTTHATSADRYKGGLLRALKAGEALYAATEGNEQIAAERAALLECLNKYADFASTAPSAYQAAIAEVEAAIDALKKAQTGGINSIASDREIVSEELFTPDGRLATTAYKGLTIRRTTYSDGTVTATKATN